MPIQLEPTKTVNRANQGGYAPAPSMPQGGTWGAAFNVDNDVVNAVELLSAPVFEADEAFDYSAKAMQSQFYHVNPNAFIGTESEAEWDWRETKIQQELKDRAILDQAGWTGFVASMVAGMASPTILLPVGSAATATNVGRAALGAAAWNVAATGIQEGVLHANQTERTGGETAVAVGSSAVLGGLLGGTIRYVDPLDIDRIGQGMVNDTMSHTVSPTAPASANGTGSLSAAVNPDPGAYRFEVDAGGLLRPKGPAGKAVDAIKWLNPLTRTVESPFQTGRWVGNNLGTGGMYRSNNVIGSATAPGGDIESLVQTHYGGFAQAIESQRRQFYDWYAKAKGGSKFRAWFASGDQRAFSTEITKALQMNWKGLKHEVPEVEEAARMYRENVFMPLIREAMDNDMRGFKTSAGENISEEAALRRVMQVINRTEAVGKYDDLKLILKEHAKSILRMDNRVIKALEWVEDFELEGSAQKIRVKDESSFLDKFELDDLADGISEKVYARMTKNFQRHGTITSMQEMPARSWRFHYVDPDTSWSNGKTFGEFLEPDIEKIARSYVRSMAPDVELLKRFGAVDPSKRESAELPFWSKIEEEYNDLAKKAEGDEKKLKRLDKQYRQLETDIEVMVGRLRHTHGMGDPSNPFARAGKSIMGINTMRLMGSVVISSMADIARPVLKYGLLNTFRHGVIPMLKDFKSFRAKAKEVQYAGSALDLLMHGRSQMLFDLFDEMQYGNLLERGINYGVQKTGIIAGFDLWNQGMKQFSGHILMGKMMNDIDDVVAGKASKAQTAFLAHLNLTPEDIRAIHKQVREGGGTEVSPGIWFPNTEDWADVGLIQRFRGALNRGVNDTIVTPGLERPSWTDASVAGRMIGQFRSFTMSSTNKVTMAALQEASLGAGNMAQVLTGTAFSLALGMISYYTWATTVGGKTRQRMLNELDAAISGDTQAMGRWADEAIGRSGLIGVLEEARNFGQKVPALQGVSTFASEPDSKNPFANPVLRSFGPTVGLAESAGKLATSIHDPDSGTFRAFQSLMPYQNVFYLRRALEEVNNAAQRAAGFNPK